jgi:hypothetical protein
MPGAALPLRAQRATGRCAGSRGTPRGCPGVGHADARGLPLSRRSGRSGGFTPPADRFTGGQCPGAQRLGVRRLDAAFGLREQQLPLWAGTRPAPTSAPTGPVSAAALRRPRSGGFTPPADRMRAAKHRPVSGRRAAPWSAAARRRLWTAGAAAPAVGRHKACPYLRPNGAGFGAALAALVAAGLSRQPTVRRAANAPARRALECGGWTPPLQVMFALLRAADSENPRVSATLLACPVVGATRGGCEYIQKLPFLGL